MLFEDLQQDLRQSQLDKNEAKVNTLRLLLSEIRYVQIKKNEGEDKPLSDEEIITVIQKEVKKRKEAADGFRQGGREESALKEENEAEILSQYLPKQLSDEELKIMIDEAISQTGATGISDMGKVIGIVMSKVKGSADGSRISMLVKEKLGQG
ncbi:MAG: GatB/YqeY domain-containing protein [Candidatus Daviesbacteria bacterium]|nr:GatB/YqeY domain-containing protein [Candidatus Daviesbacteria bacterium]